MKQNEYQSNNKLSFWKNNLYLSKSIVLGFIKKGTEELTMVCH